MYEKKFFSTLTEGRPQTTFENLGKEIGIVLVIKGWIATQEDVGNHSDAPDINCLSIRLLGQYLWSHVTWSATRCGHDTRVFQFAQPEVTDHDLTLFLLTVVQQVLGLWDKIIVALSTDIQRDIIQGN